MSYRAFIMPLLIKWSDKLVQQADEFYKDGVKKVVTV